MNTKNLWILTAAFTALSVACVEETKPEDEEDGGGVEGGDGGGDGGSDGAADGGDGAADGGDGADGTDGTDGSDGTGASLAEPAGYTEVSGSSVSGFWTYAFYSEDIDLCGFVWDVSGVATDAKCPDCEYGFRVDKVINETETTCDPAGLNADFIEFSVFLSWPYFYSGYPFGTAYLSDGTWGLYTYLYAYDSYAGASGYDGYWSALVTFDESYFEYNGATYYYLPYTYGYYNFVGAQ